MKQKLHPELMKVQSIWMRIKILKEELRSQYADFMIAWPNESIAGRKERAESFLAGFVNPSQMLLRSKGDTIYKKEIQRNTPSTGQAQFIEAADRSGQGFQEILHHEVAPTLAAYGTIFAILDKPTAAADAVTKEEELRIGMPYLTILDPFQVIDFEYGADGRLLWFKYTVDAPVDRTDPWNPKQNPAWKTSRGIATWTQLTYSVRSPNNKTQFYVPEVPNPFGFVPVLIQAQNVEPNHTIGASTFFSSSDYLVMGNNLDNAANVEVFKNASATLLMQNQDWDDDQQPSNTTDPTTNLRVLNKKAHDFKNVLVYQKDKPEFMTRDLDLITFAEGRSKRFFDMAVENERHVLAVMNKDIPASGVSKAYDFIDTNAMLAGFAAAMERFEKQVLAMVAAMLDESPDCVVVYPSDYDVRTFSERLQYIQDLLKANYPSPIGLKAAYKSLTPEITQNADEATTINNEIDAATLDTTPAATPYQPPITPQ